MICNHQKLIEFASVFLPLLPRQLRLWILDPDLALSLAHLVKEMPVRYRQVAADELLHLLAWSHALDDLGEADWVAALCHGLVGLQD
jgi:hypothetical protein